MNYTRRIAALRRTFKKHKADAFVVSHLVNVRYLCGYTGSSGMVVLTPDAAWFITDFRYRAQAAEQIGADYEVVIADRGLWEEAARMLKKAKAAQIAIESEHTSVAMFHDIVKLVKPSNLVPVFRAVETLRLHKDADEIDIIKRAADIIDDCFAEFCKILRPGITEMELSGEMTRQMQARGASGPSFETIVASGARSALPHGVASHKKIENGDLVTLDMGAVFDGYCSDFTRTVCVGRPTREQQRIYELVWLAQTAACEAIRPGLACKAADGVARKIIEEAGLGEAFGHGLGHGVGMDIHEQPRLSRLGKGKLESGMVVTSEPGIYIDGWGGVRIEDLLVVTEGGVLNLTHGKKPRKLMAL